VRKRVTNQFRAEGVLALLWGDQTVGRISSERNAAPTYRRLAPDEAGNGQIKPGASTRKSRSSCPTDGVYLTPFSRRNTEVFYNP